MILFTAEEKYVGKLEKTHEKAYFDPNWRRIDQKITSFVKTD